MMLYPLAIGAACVVTSIIGTFFVKLGSNNSIMGALYKGFIATGLLSLVALWRRDRIPGRHEHHAQGRRRHLHGLAAFLLRHRRALW